MYIHICMQMYMYVMVKHKSQFYYCADIELLEQYSQKMWPLSLSIHLLTCAGSTLSSLCTGGASPCSLHLPCPGPPSVYAIDTPSLPSTPTSLPSACVSSRHRNPVATGLSLQRITRLKCECKSMYRTIPTCVQ